MTHTPGEWGYDGTGCIYSHSLPREDCVIAELQQASEDWEADGHLLAAAPELLAALRQAKSELLDLYEEAHPDDESDNSVTAAIDRAIAAIKKAEGRSE
jgi:hypothetical protein